MNLQKYIKYLVFIVLIIASLFYVNYRIHKLCFIKFKPGKFKLSVIKNELYGLCDGEIYMYRENEGWENLEYREKVSAMISGDRICLLEQDGDIYIEIFETTSSVPLTTGAASEFQNRILEINKSHPFKAINGSAYSLWFCAILSDDSLLYPIKNCEFGRFILDEKPIDLKEDYILTENGNVYRLINHGYDRYGNAKIELKKIYTGENCIKMEIMNGNIIGVGINDAYEVIVWNDSKKDFPDLTDWDNIREVELSQTFVAGLAENGTVIFEHLWDDEQTENVQNIVSAWENIIDIEHYYNEWLYAVDDNGKCYCVEIK